MSEGGEVSEAGPGGEVGVTEPQFVGAIVRLRDRYASDEMSLEDFSRALDGVLAARTAQELARASPSRELRAPASRVSWRGAEALQQHLWPEEEILWVGRPEGTLNLTRGSRLAFVPFMAFAAIWETIAISGGAPYGFDLFGFIIIVIGGYNAFGRFVVQGRRTIYAVTTRRIVRIVRRSSGDQTDSKLLSTIPNISIVQGKHDRGTVTFGDGTAVPSSRGISILRYDNSAEAISFVNVAEPAAVARLIGSLQAYEVGATPSRGADPSR